MIKIYPQKSQKTQTIFAKLRAIPFVFVFNTALLAAALSIYAILFWFGIPALVRFIAQTPLYPPFLSGFAWFFTITGDVVLFLTALILLYQLTPGLPTGMSVADKALRKTPFIRLPYATGHYLFHTLYAFGPETSHRLIRLTLGEQLEPRSLLERAFVQLRSSPGKSVWQDFGAKLILLTLVPFVAAVSFVTKRSLLYVYSSLGQSLLRVGIPVLAAWLGAFFGIDAAGIGGNLSWFYSLNVWHDGFGLSASLLANAASAGHLGETLLNAGSVFVLLSSFTLSIILATIRLIGLAFVRRTPGTLAPGWSTFVKQVSTQAFWIHVVPLEIELILFFSAFLGPVHALVEKIDGESGYVSFGREFFRNFQLDAYFISPEPIHLMNPVIDQSPTPAQAHPNPIVQIVEEVPPMKIEPRDNDDDAVKSRLSALEIQLKDLDSRIESATAERNAAAARLKEVESERISAWEKFKQAAQTRTLQIGEAARAASDAIAKQQALAHAEKTLESVKALKVPDRTAEAGNAIRYFSKEKDFLKGFRFSDPEYRSHMAAFGVANAMRGDPYQHTWDHPSFAITDRDLGRIVNGQDLAKLSAEQLAELGAKVARDTNGRPLIQVEIYQRGRVSYYSDLKWHEQAIIIHSDAGPALFKVRPGEKLYDAYIAGWQKILDQSREGNRPAVAAAEKSLEDAKENLIAAKATLHRQTRAFGQWTEEKNAVSRLIGTSIHAAEAKSTQNDLIGKLTKWNETRSSILAEMEEAKSVPKRPAGEKGDEQGSVLPLPVLPTSEAALFANLIKKLNDHTSLDVRRELGSEINELLIRMPSSLEIGTVASRPNTGAPALFLIDRLQENLTDPSFSAEFRKELASDGKEPSDHEIRWAIAGMAALGLISIPLRQRLKPGAAEDHSLSVLAINRGMWDSLDESQRTNLINIIFTFHNMTGRDDPQGKMVIAVHQDGWLSRWAFWSHSKEDGNLFHEVTEFTRKLHKDSIQVIEAPKILRAFDEKRFELSLLNLEEALRANGISLNEKTRIIAQNAILQKGLDHSANGLADFTLIQIGELLDSVEMPKNELRQMDRVHQTVSSGA